MYIILVLNQLIFDQISCSASGKNDVLYWLPFNLNEMLYFDDVAGTVVNCFAIEFLNAQGIKALSQCHLV